MCHTIENIFISTFSALLTPTIAVAAICISFSNLRLAKRRRKDELFDRRYAFYKDFEKFWKSTGPESQGATSPSVEWDDLEYWLMEANFLFGKDIVKHLKSYEGRAFNGLRWMPDKELAKPFEKYLKF